MGTSQWMGEINFYELETLCLSNESSSPYEEYVLQPIKEIEKVVIERKEENPILLFEDLFSFVEEEKDNKVVPFLEEQIMPFEPS